MANEIAWALDIEFLFLVGEFALLSMIFLAIAHWKSLAVEPIVIEHAQNFSPQIDISRHRRVPFALIEI